MSKKPVVIAGAGHAGVQVAVSLRQNGSDQPIVLIGDEKGLPYQRPPLSKSYLLGRMKRDALWLRPETFYRGNDIELLNDAGVASIDRRGKRVTLGTGTTLAYSHLVLALGARNRSLALEGSDLRGIYSIRTLTDIDTLATPLANAQTVAVIGGGFIGLEFAAVACAMGKDVTVIESAARVMSRVVSPCISEYFTDWHTKQGVKLAFGSTVERLVGSSGQVSGVEVAGRDILPADFVVVSVGVTPNVELAARAGIVTGDGIIVDGRLLTSDPDISAIGDCAMFPSMHTGTALRLESVQNANDQARTVAVRLTGRTEAYGAVPWFWSDQGDQKLQIVGVTPAQSDIVLRGEPSSTKFSAYHFLNDRLVSIESVNSPSDHMLGRRLLSSNKSIQPEQACDTAFDLKSLL